MPPIWQSQFCSILDIISNKAARQHFIAFKRHFPIIRTGIENSVKAGRYGGGDINYISKAKFRRNQASGNDLFYSSTDTGPGWSLEIPYIPWK